MRRKRHMAEQIETQLRGNIAMSRSPSTCADACNRTSNLTWISFVCGVDWARLLVWIVSQTRAARISDRMRRWCILIFR
jgi:hypothetical protein